MLRKIKEKFTLELLVIICLSALIPVCILYAANISVICKCILCMFSAFFTTITLIKYNNIFNNNV